MRCCCQQIGQWHHSADYTSEHALTLQLLAALTYEAYQPEVAPRTSRGIISANGCLSAAAALRLCRPYSGSVYGLQKIARGELAPLGLRQPRPKDRQTPDETGLGFGQRKRWVCTAQVLCLPLALLAPGYACQALLSQQQARHPQYDSLLACAVAPGH